VSGAEDTAISRT